MGTWNHEKLRNKRIEKAAADKLIDLSKEELIKKIIDLETALYPFAYTLGSIDANPPRGLTITSNLFAELDENRHHQIWDDEKKQFVSVKDLPEKDRHKHEYVEAEAAVNKGADLDDSFSIIYVQQEFYGGCAMCGTINMSDIRIAKNLLFPPEEKVIVEDS